MQLFKKISILTPIVIFLIFLLSGIAFGATNEEELKGVYEKARHSTVMVETNSGTGSGFYVDAHYIITNAHVVGGSDYVQIIQTEGEKEYYYKGDVIYANGDIDLAVIYVKDTTGLPLKISTTPAEVGDTLFSLQSPYGFYNTLVTGHVAGINRTFEGYGYNRYLQVELDLAPGSSGSAVLNKNGEVVGISVALVGVYNSAEFALGSYLLYYGPVQEIILHKKGLQ